MKNQKYKDQFRRNSYKKSELNCYVSKASLFLKLSVNTNSYKKDSNICRVNNRCLISYRNRSVFRYFRLNRGLLRNHLVFNEIPGVHKSSW